MRHLALAVLLLWPAISQADPLKIQYRLDGVTSQINMGDLTFNYAAKTVEVFGESGYIPTIADFPANSGSELSFVHRYDDFSICTKFEGLVLKYNGAIFTVQNLGVRWVGDEKIMYFDLMRGE